LYFTLLSFHNHTFPYTSIYLSVLYNRRGTAQDFYHSGR
jgi:hypothetical protein